VTSAIAVTGGRAVMRAGRQYLHTAIAVHRHPHASPAELKAFQDARLRQLVVHAYENVPYYRKLFDRQRLHPRHIRGTVDLDLIPITTRDDLLARPPMDLIARGTDPASLIPIRGDSSSERPFIVRRSWLEQSYSALFRARAYASFGLGLRGRIAEVGLPRPAEYQNHKLVSRTIESVGFHPSLILDGRQAPASTVDHLEAFQPDMLIGFPGMLCVLANYLEEERRLSIRPRIVVTAGEILTPLARERLTEVFGVEPLQVYTSHEVQLLGWECRATNAIHVCDDGAIVEVLRDDRPVGPDEQGEVVTTNLSAYAMPLIRYRLGDMVTRGPQHCHCGQPFSTISTIQGPANDCFKLADGRVIYPTQILECFPPNLHEWVRQYQLVQARPDCVILRIVAGGKLSPEVSSRMAKAVAPLLGPGIEFQVTPVADIPLDSNGKFHHAHG
jgi:phenylacetate-CoA ligase